ncbi:MAG: hypothetical protein HS100_01580 [Anaerolineales bacterium]|nr:MAG: hypothetical protein EDM79_01155 [Chloroflexota bacterium]MBE7432585.1 hypothetical protein [Anaerolineales bacterium]GJQ34898.1 MAG: hypothetical protein JETCAE01_09080 [Anaerolineaceae bacterium]
MFDGGWNGVTEIVGLGVMLGVREMVGVMTCGVPLTVAVAGVMVPVTVIVKVGVGVASRGFGANERQTNPAQ